MPDIVTDLRREYRSAPVLYITVTALIFCVNLVSSSLGLVLYTVALKPLTIRNPNQLVVLSAELTGPAYDSLRELNLASSGPFDDMFAWVDNGANDFVEVSSGDGTSFKASYVLVSGNASSALGLLLKLGRMLQPVDDAPGGGPGGWKCVISEDAWRVIFHANPDIIGKTLYVNGVTVTVIGVQDHRLSSLNATQHPSLFLPLEFVDVYIQGRSFKLRHNPRADWISVFGRLRRTASPKQAQVFLNAALRREQPQARVELGPENLSVYPAGRGDRALSQQYGTVLRILGALGLLLAVSCGVACSLLMSVRFVVNSKAMAIKAALGASRSRLLWNNVGPLLPIFALTSMLPYYLHLHLANTVLGMLLRTHSHIESVLSVDANSRFDMSSFSYWGSEMIIAGVVSVCVAIGAQRVSTSAVTLGLAAGSHGGTRKRKNAIQFLIAIETCAASIIAMLSLSAASTVFHFVSAKNGIDIRQVLVWPVTVAKPGASVNVKANAARLLQIVDTLRESLGSNAVSAAFYPILQGVEAQTDIHPEHGEDQRFAINYITNGFFATMAQKLLRGSDFQRKPETGSILPCILNLQGVGKLSPEGEDILGERLRLKRLALGGPSDCTVIGVVDNAPYSSMREEPKPTIYVPLFGKSTPDSAFIFARGNPNAVRGAVERIAKEQGMGAQSPPTVALESEVLDQLGRERALAWIGAAFGALAIAVSLLSAFLVASGGLQAQSREIAIRLALGATRRSLVRLLTTEFGLIPLIGSIIGSLIAYFALLKVGQLLTYSDRQLADNAVEASVAMMFFLALALIKVIAAGSNQELDVKSLHEL